MAARDTIVAEANRWLGTLYDWGGEGLNGEGVDCSGLVIAAYRAAGLKFHGRPIASQLGAMGVQVNQAEALPGDVVYYDEPGPTDHVGIYLGNGQMIDSPTEGEKVRVDKVGKPTSIRRLVGHMGASGTLPGETTGPPPLPGFGDVTWYGDVLGSSWGADALKIGVQLVGTIAAVALVVVGVVHTVKNENEKS